MMSGPRIAPSVRIARAIFHHSALDPSQRRKAKAKATSTTPRSQTPPRSCRLRDSTLSRGAGKASRNTRTTLAAVDDERDAEPGSAEHVRGRHRGGSIAEVRRKTHGMEDHARRVTHGRRRRARGLRLEKRRREHQGRHRGARRGAYQEDRSDQRREHAEESRLWARLNWL